MLLTQIVFQKQQLFFDEGKMHGGRTKIIHWIENANKKYHTVMKSISYVEKETESILIAENSGTFPGSPVILQYHFEITS